MKSVDLKQIGENEYRVCGYIDVFCREEKEIVVDGERYVNTKCFDKKIILEEEFLKKDNKDYKYRWYCEEIDDFDIVGIPKIKIWDWRGIYGGAVNLLRSEKNNLYSENKSINLLIYLAGELGIDVSTGSCLYLPNMEAFERRLLKDFEIEIMICDYGFNNGLFVTIPYIDLINMNFNKIDEFYYNQIKDIVKKCEYRIKHKKLAKFFPKQLFTNKLTELHKQILLTELLMQSVDYRNNNKNLAMYR